MLMENQQIRFSSSIQSIQQLLMDGRLGDLLEVQVCIGLNIFGPDSAYIDQSAPHFGLALRGGVIGDFLPHIAYLAHIFAGPIGDFERYGENIQLTLRCLRTSFARS